MTSTLRAPLCGAVVFLFLTAAGAAGAQTTEFLSGQAAAEPVVTGAPYSGDAVTTVKAVLFDGTRIERTITARFYRDSAGRVRRDQTVTGLEALQPSDDSAKVVIIIDPVAAAVYSLSPGGLAYRLPMDRRGGTGAPQPPAPAASSVSLGTKPIDGLTAIGTKSVSTIPAHQVGNDRPIEISDERWESPELKVVLFSRHHDPRTGDIEFRLTNISRSEPARDLFTVPASYRMIDAPPRPQDAVRAPVVQKEVKPLYTREAMAQRIEGSVGVDVVVLEDGSVGDVTVTRSLDTQYGLDDEAVKAVKQWRFRPGMKNGKPVAVSVSIEMTFTLK